MKFFTQITIAFACLFCSSYSDDFSEELFIRRLPDNHIYAQFNFVINRGANDSHFELFPKSLGDVFTKYDVDELHLSVTQGMWRHTRWGYPVNNDAPHGTELWAWFKYGVSNVDEQWKRLTSALSGAFCTSLQFMDAKSTFSPRFSYKMTGDSPIKDNNRRIISDKNLARYSALPGETPCTNTLTPWTKLLPCHTKAGLGSLLEPHTVFAAGYASLSIHYMHKCPSDTECTDPNQQISLRLALVYNPLTSNLMNQVTLRKLFTRDIQAPCILAKTSKILVDAQSFQPKAVITPATSGVLFDGKIYEFSLSRPLLFSLPFDLNIRFIKGKFSLDNRVPIITHRYLAANGQRSGTIVCQIDNRLSDSVPVIYTQTFPWFLYVYLHTLRISAKLGNFKNMAISPAKTHYVPSQLRENPGLLEITFKLPPKSVTTIMLDVDYQLLRWTEYPPDANHGFFINAGAITALLPWNEETGYAKETLPREFSTLTDYLKYRSESSDNANSFTYVLRLYTESLLIYLPTPDFSMPYNALCLVCTVVAIGFGSVHSLTTKRFILVDPNNPPSSTFGKVKTAIAGIKAKFLGGSANKESKDEEKTTKQD